MLNIVKIQVYIFDSNNFCLNGNNCQLIHYYGYYKLHRKIDCKCPDKQSFRCDNGKYCASDSIACGYYELKKFQLIKMINHCGNNNSNYFKLLFTKTTF